MTKKSLNTPGVLPTWHNKAWMILALLSIVAYGNTLFNDFALDDSIVITDNMYTVQGVKGWPGLLSKDTFHGFFQKDGKAQLVAGGRYRPLSPMVFALEYQVFGEKAMFYHLINILLYTLLVVVLFKWLMRLFKDNPHAFWLSFLTTLLFALHPLHTEVVANIKGRDEIFALLFALLSASVILKSQDDKNGILVAQLLSGFWFFLGLMSKENTITFLAIIPASVFFFRSKKAKDLILSLAGPFIATLVFLVIRSYVLGSTFSDPPLELMNNPFLKWTGEGYTHLTMIEKLPMIILALGKYLVLFIVPHPLTHDYYPKMIESLGMGNWKVILSLLAYVLLAIFMFFSHKKRPIISFAILIFFASLSIVSNLIFPVGTHMSERFLFMPSVGLSLFVISLLVYFLADYSKIWKGVVMIVACLFMIKTVARNPVWKNNFSLFTTDIAVSSRSAKLQNAVGGVLLEDIGQLEGLKKTTRAQEAIQHLLKAKELHPTYKSPNLLLGNAYYYIEDYEKAKKYYKEALRIDNRYIDAIINLAICEREQGNFDESIRLFNTVSNDAKAGDKAKAQLIFTYEDAGKALSSRGHLDKALGQFEKGLKLGGEKAKFNYFLGVTYAQKQDLEKALFYLEEALKHQSEEDNRQNIIRARNQVKSDLSKQKK